MRPRNRITTRLIMEMQVEVPNRTCFHSRCPSPGVVIDSAAFDVSGFGLSVAFTG